MTTKAATIAALLITATTLQGCESISDFIDIFSGKPSAAQRRHEAARVNAVMVVPPATANTFPVEQPPVEVASVAVVEPTPDPGPPPFECVTIFRVQTCDDGVLYMLDSNMNWILPGRTE